MRLAEALLQALRRAGAQEIFGIPGDFALPLFDVIERTAELPLYTLSHEPAVGFAADAATRFHGGIGVAAITYGAGAFNLVNPIAGAYAERSPVVVLSGAPSRAERSSGLLVHHQARTIESQLNVYREITCDQAVLDDPATASGEIARVLRTCRERSQPVYIEVPRDMVEVDIAPVPVLPPSPVDADAVAAAAAEILERLRSARSPVLMVDAEIRRYGIEEAVAGLAQQLGIPVVTTFMGRGLLADSANPPLGTYIGVAGQPEISELVESSDALLLLGVILSDTNFAISMRQIDLRQTILAAERQVRLGFHVYADVPLADLVTAMAGMARPLGMRLDLPDPPPPPYDLPADDASVSPNDIATAINDMMRSHGPLPMASDMGDCLFTAMDIDQHALAAPGYYAGMGFGVPAGLGVQVATGERPLVLVGDGAFAMTGWELGNCRRYGWDPIVIVFNNASWEMLRAFQPDAGFNDLDDWPFHDLAGPLGGLGIRVHTRRELAEALELAVATRDRFVLIDVVMERGRMSGTLSRFVEGFTRRRAAAEAT
ncbi:MAG: indolepyruvate/phenylpyruvate decarboxylase [Candidatus Limnocylindrales bacterium]